MLQRLIQLAIRSYVGGPAKSWLFTSAALWLLGKVRSTIGRQELVDVSALKPGETLVIQNLDVSHRRQIRDIKKSDKADRKSRKSERRKRKSRKSDSGESRDRQSRFRHRRGQTSPD